MQEATARTIANVALVSAGVAAAVVILTRPPLRRFVLRALRVWLGASVPVYLVSQAHQAWLEAGQAPRLRSGQAPRLRSGQAA